jgi:FkbM family methyltransferase
MKLLNPVPPQDAVVTTRLRGFASLLSYDPKTFIGSFVYFRGVFEEEIVAALAKVLKPGMTFIDIGANIGHHTCIGAELVGSSGRVLAIEPQASVRKRLLSNVELNRYSHVTVSSYAIGDKVKAAKLYHLYDANDGAATLGTVAGADFEEVQVVPMLQVTEKLGLASADVVKIDVEGAEYEVLRGAEGFFDKSPPSAIFVECIDEYLQRFGHRASDVIAWLHNRDYRVMALKRGRWLEVPRGANVSADLAAYK